MADLLTEKTEALRDLLAGLEESRYPTALDYVQALRMIRETAESALQQAVPAAVHDGATWAQVGKMLDVSAQAAHQRYAEPTITMTCGCGAHHTSTDRGEVEAWADTHTDTEHADEVRWPNTLTVEYARRRRLDGGPSLPKDVYYRWPGGQPPATSAAGPDQSVL